jgi:FkbM family methyltransferase
MVEVAYLLLKRSSGPLRIVQIGAFDGIHNDPLHRILSDDLDACAIIVEPQSAPFATLKTRFSTHPSVHLENVAIVDRDGPTKMWMAQGNEYSSKASLRPDVALKYGSKRLRSIQVEGITIRQLLKRHHWESVDLLQIDAEGCDLEILEQFFEIGVQPLAVNLERWHLDTDSESHLRRLMTSHGYHFLDWNRDRLALKKELLRIPSSRAASHPKLMK